MASHTLKKLIYNGSDTQTESAVRDGDGNVISSTYAKLSGATFTGNIILKSESGDSPYLEFLRGTEADNYNDWRIIDSGGYLYFKQKGQSDADFTNVFTITNQGDFTMSGNGVLNLTRANFTNTSHFIRKNTSTNLLELGAGGNTVMQVGSGTSTVASNFRTTTNNQKDLGQSAYQWHDFYMGGQIKTGTNSSVALTLPSASGTLATTDFVSANPQTTTDTLTGITINGTSYAIQGGGSAIEILDLR